MAGRRDERSRGAAPSVIAACLLTLLSGCGGADPGTERRTPAPGAQAKTSASPEALRATQPPQADLPEPEADTGVRRQRVRPSDGKPQDAVLTIPRLGLDELPVMAYRGRTDDAAGTAIQNGGVAASPHGPRGGTGAGGVGNYQVTAHRLSAGGAFRDLPSLRRGDRVRVAAEGATYVYEVRRTRITSFRSARSLREQRAAVPGRPGAAPTKAMITLSTCRTLEDHAEGNYWSDRFDNPENRIDKIGVLVRTIAAG